MCSPFRCGVQLLIISYRLYEFLMSNAKGTSIEHHVTCILGSYLVLSI